MKKSLLLLVVSVLLIGIAIWNNQDKSTSTVSNNGAPTKIGGQVGDLGPSISLNVLGSEMKPITVGGKQDKPIFVNFWASWCDPCKAEAPDLVKLHEKYKDKLLMVSINVTAHDTEEGAKEFVAAYGLTNPVLLDSRGQAFKAYNGIGFPTNVLLDKNGVIRQRYDGIRPPAELEQAIQQVIAE